MFQRNRKGGEQEPRPPPKRQRVRNAYSLEFSKKGGWIASGYVLSDGKQKRVKSNEGGNGWRTRVTFFGPKIQKTGGEFFGGARKVGENRPLLENETPNRGQKNRGMHVRPTTGQKPADHFSTTKRGVPAQGKRNSVELREKGFQLQLKSAKGNCHCKNGGVGRRGTSGCSQGPGVPPQKN